MVGVHVEAFCVLSHPKLNHQALKSPFLQCKDYVIHIVKLRNQIHLDMESGYW